MTLLFRRKVLLELVEFENSQNLVPRILTSDIWPAVQQHGDL